MTRKTLVDKDILIARTEEYVNQWAGNYKLLYKERAKWGEIDKQRWKNAKANVYHQLRQENKRRCKQFWLEQMDNGSFKEFFKKCGLMVWNGQVCFADCGSVILTHYINNQVLPRLEKEMNIKGVKVRHKRITGMTNDIFDWEQAEIANEGGSN